jgi:hypothetical protein
LRETIRFKLPWEPVGVTFIGDPHIDARTHARDLLLADLDRAKENGDSLVIMGDIWSYILPTDTKRFTSGKNAEHVDDIIGRAVDNAYQLFLPYVDNIDVMLLGNHETNVLKRHHIDPLRLLIQRLNDQKQTGRLQSMKIAHGGYTCWLQFQFTRQTNSVSQFVWTHHGSGGSAPVTKGMIDGNRIKVARHADVYVIAHKHTHIHDRDRFEFCDSYGNRRTVERDYIVVGGYSGIENHEDYEQDGYKLDWSEETFYGLESQGSTRILFTPYDRGSGTKEAQRMGVRRSVMTETMA